MDSKFLNFLNFLDAIVLKDFLELDLWRQPANNYRQ